MSSKRSSDFTDQSSKRVRSSSSSEESEHDDDSTVPESLTNPIAAQSQPEVGIIESISLKNFMCHGYLEFKFGNNVNFIHGRNGSGKSAILTAVVVGLGGAASVTNRGSSVKNFIQNGKSRAEIAIRLRNVGEDSFKFDQYGSSIVVERQLLADGSSKYKLKSESEKIMSSKKEELIHILEHFNIQIDNPLCVLNQDLSRKFLQSADPKALYKFFMKATQLEQMKQNYDSIILQKKSVKSTLQQKMQVLPELEKEENDWKAKLDVHHSLDHLRTKINTLYAELAWAQVKGLEEEWSSEEKKMNELRSLMPRFMQKVEDYKVKLKEAQNKHKEVSEELEALSNELNKNRPECEELKKSLALKKQLQQNAYLECKRVASNVQVVQKDQAEIVKRIEELKRGESGDYAAEKQRRQERIELLENERRELGNRSETTELQCEHLRSALAQCREQMDGLKQEDGNVRNDIEGIGRKLRNLESSRSNHVKRFGQWVPEALGLIEQAYHQKKFRHKPRGPIGAYVRLRDNKWNLAVENCIKPLLYAFCCDNHDDQRVLEGLLGRLIRQHNTRMPTIITSRFGNGVYDVRSHSVQSSKYSSVLDMLEIDDPVIANVLIDQRRVESILLIENSAEARRVMTREVPRNCEEAFTIVGDQLYPAPRFRVYSSQRDKADLLQASVDDLIRTLQYEHANLEQQQLDVQQRLADVGQKCNGSVAELRKADSDLVRLQQKIRDAKSELNDLKSVVDPEPVYITSLEVDLQELKSQYDTLKEQSGGTVAAYQACKADTAKAMQEYQAVDERLTSLLTEKLDPLKELFATVDREQDVTKDSLQHYQMKLNEHEEKVSVLAASCGEKKTELDKYAELTEKKFGPCLERVRNATKINKEIEQTEKVLASKQDMHGTKDAVTAKYVAVKKKNKDILSAVDAIKDFVVHLDSMMSRRQKYYHEMRTYLSNRVKQYFITLLSLRNFTGTIKLDHQAETLRIMFQEKQKDVMARALSGGERSFTTVCFILSLWETIESPFRMMDEFDVFMDMVNRHFSMTMLIDVATSKFNNQFIFLTPLDISAITPSNSIRIFRMKDPERNQGVLPFQPVGQERGSDDES